MTKQSKNGFQVKFDGVELGEAALARIEYEIQVVILHEFAALHPTPEDIRPGLAIVLPKFWRGFILRKLSNEDVNIMGQRGALNILMEE